jgi:hypothetical protein
LLSQITAAFSGNINAKDNHYANRDQNQKNNDIHFQSLLTLNPMLMPEFEDQSKEQLTLCKDSIKRKPLNARTRRKNTRLLHRGEKKNMLLVRTSGCLHHTAG